MSEVEWRAGFMENSIIIGKNSEFVSKFKQNDRESVIVNSVHFNITVHF